MSFILYNRLIRIRLPREFTDIFVLIKILVLSSMLILLILNIYFLYKNYKKINDKQSLKIILFLKELYNKPYNPIILAINSLKALDWFIKGKTPSYNDLESYSDFITKKIAQIFENNKYILIIVFILKILPQLIVCSSFILDIVYNNKFEYFYKTLWLLIFPLLLTYIIYSIKNYIDHNLKQLNSLLSLKLILKENMSSNVTLDDMESISVYEWQNIILSNDSELYYCAIMLSSETLEFFGEDKISATYCLDLSSDVLNNIYIMDNSMTKYAGYKTKIELPFNIIKYVIYSIGWFIILFI